VVWFSMNIRFPGHNHNNKFKSDSQRSASSLQVSLVFMAQWFKSGGSVVHTLIWRYVYRGKNEDKEVDNIWISSVLKCL
jgi:hypothetical protein